MKPLILFILFLFPAFSFAERTPSIQGFVLSLSGDHISIDVGVAQGLLAGDVGKVRHNGIEIADVEVISVELQNAILRVIASAKGQFPAEGDPVVFLYDAKNNSINKSFVPPPKPKIIVEDTAPQKRLAPEPVKTVLAPELPETSTVTFTPVITAEKPKTNEVVLLPAVSPKVKIKTGSTTANVFHGRMRVWQFYQSVTPLTQDFEASRIDSDGSVERIDGGPWSFVWSGNATYRDGNRTSDANDFRHVKPHLMRLTVARRFANEQDFFKLGRFYPIELSGAGTIDGTQLHLSSGKLNYGAVTGLRPDRRFQEFSKNEPLAGGYIGTNVGDMLSTSYFGSIGGFQSYYLGRCDELAAVVDQRLSSGRLLNVYNTAQFNFNSGSAVIHRKPRLTRLNLSIMSNPFNWLSLRAGTNHYEPIDIAAERALILVNAAAFIDNGYWRHWVGTGQNLPWNIYMDEELSFTRDSSGLKPGLWRYTLSRQGLPQLPMGRIFLNLYNINNPLGTEYGGSSGVQFPLLDNKLNLDTSAGFRYAHDNDNMRKFKVGDINFRISWSPTQAWQADLAVSRIYQGGINSSSVSGGISYRW